MTLSSEIDEVLTKLQAHGQGYIVGGFVRDMLLNIEPKDCDFCTDLPAAQLLSVFSSYKPKLVGKSFEVVKIKVNETEFDIARMREDISFTDNRRVTGVSFVSDIETDLRRRDFTINAIAWDGRRFYYADKHCLKDIHSRTLRFVGDPAGRIKEDPLRMLRAVRILIEKDLSSIEDVTFQAIRDNCCLLRFLSKERIRDEFTRVIVSRQPKRGILFLYKCGLLREFLPELCACLDFSQNHPEVSKDIFGHTLLVLENTANDLILRMAALLHDIAKPKVYQNNGRAIHFIGHEALGADMAKVILKRLAYPNEFVDTVVLLIENHLRLWQIHSKKAAKKLLSQVGAQNAERLYKLAIADIRGSYPPWNFSSVESAMQWIREALTSGDAFSLRDLAIDGNDLIRMGLSPGPEFGALLNKCLDCVLENPDFNQKDQLTVLLKRMISSSK